MPKDSPASRFARQLVRSDDLDGFIAAHRHRLDESTFIDLKEEVDRLVKVDLTAAGPLAYATRKLAGRLKDPVSIGLGDAALAQLHHYAGRLAKAEPLYVAAIARLRKHDRRKEAAALERQLVGLMHRQGRAKEAIALARRARKTLADAGEHLLVAQLDNNVGSLYYYTLAQYRTAMRYFDRARALFAKAGDTSSAAIVDFNRANVLLELDQPHEAAALYDAAERINVSEGRSVFANQCSYQHAFTLATLGRYGDALKRFYTTRDRFVELGDAVSAAWSALYLADLCVRLNSEAEAYRLAETAEQEFDALDHHRIEAARARIVRARVLARRGDFENANKLTSHAERTFAKQGAIVLAAEARLARAELALASGKSRFAAKLAREAGAMFASQRLRGRRAYAAFTEGRAEERGGNRAAAIRLLRTALKAADRASDPWLASQASAAVGILELDAGRHTVGVEALERSVAEIEALRQRLRPGEARTGFLSDKLAPYERLVRHHLERGGIRSLKRAFKYIEMAKSRSLADLISRHIARSGDAESAAERKLREDLARRLEELNWYASRVANQNEKGGQRNARLDAHLRSELTRCEHDLDIAFRRVENDDDRLAELIAAPTAGLDDLAMTLAEDEAALEYFVDDHRVSAFLVTRSGPIRHEFLADRRSIETRIGALRYQLEKFGLGARYASAHSAGLHRTTDSHLSALHASLLEPFSKDLEGRKLHIIPHGVLHHVPFHALKASDGRYVVEQHELSYAPSATVLQLASMREVRPARATTLLAVGLDDSLAPHIVDELKSIGAIFPDAVVLSGENARKRTFLDRAPSSSILHLATHGTFRNDNPMFSSVRLADGPLNFYDLFGLTLDADLVTLSACNTGMNGLAPGDELNGLMRGFLYAGAPSLLVSLWAVNDRSTSDLMQSFYRNLRAGLGKRTALREAQLESLEAFGHPYYWAPFILMGRA